MTDLDDHDLMDATTPATPNVTTKRCRRHVWSEVGTCVRCPSVRDEGTTRRNKNNRQRGAAFERTVAKKLGGRRTGPLGGRDDVQVGSFAAVQTKKSHSFSLTQARTYLDDLQRAFPDKVALVVHGKPGRPSDPVVILTLEAWVALHGGDGVE